VQTSTPTLSSVQPRANGKAWVQATGFRSRATDEHGGRLNHIVQWVNNGSGPRQAGRARPSAGCRLGLLGVGIDVQSIGRVQRPDCDITARLTGGWSASGDSSLARSVGQFAQCFAVSTTST
jgi:hypothetical protein